MGYTIWEETTWNDHKPSWTETCEFCKTLYPFSMAYFVTNTVEVLWADTRKRTAQLTAVLTLSRLGLCQWRNPIWTLAHTNSVFTHSHKRPVPVAYPFSASRRCPLTGASTVRIHLIFCCPSILNNNMLNRFECRLTFVECKTIHPVRSLPTLSRRCHSFSRQWLTFPPLSRLWCSRW